MPLAEALMDGLPPANTGPVAIAVSGGLDSWVLAALARRKGLPVCAYTLVTRIHGYCEAETTRKIAQMMGIPLIELPASLQEMEDALPRFVAITRTSIYNLHPVSKLLLAERLAARGIQSIVGGDAADQVFRKEPECDLLPLTQACFAHAGVELVLPFLSPHVAALCPEPDPEKRLLRQLAERQGLPDIPKRPTLVPGESILRQTQEMLCADSPD